MRYLRVQLTLAPASSPSLCEKMGGFCDVTRAKCGLVVGTALVCFCTERCAEGCGELAQWYWAGGGFTGGEYERMHVGGEKICEIHGLEEMEAEMSGRYT